MVYGQIQVLLIHKSLADFGNTTRNLKFSVIRYFQTNDDKCYPVSFCFAGGGWMDTDHIVTAIKYSFLDKAAIRYIRANADRFYADPDRFVAMDRTLPVDTWQVCWGLQMV